MKNGTQALKYIFNRKVFFLANIARKKKRGKASTVQKRGKLSGEYYRVTIIKAQKLEPNVCL